MLIVSEASARAVFDAVDALAAVEACLVSLYRGEAETFPVVMGHGTDLDTRFGVKCGLDRALALPGLKVGTYWPGNRARGLASHGSTTVLLDDATGLPRALIASTYLTALRTAAADAAAVKHLARPDARKLGIVGAGHQAFADMLAIAAVRPIDEIMVWSRSDEVAARFAERGRAAGLPVRTTGLEALVRGSDIVATVTPSRAPIFPAEWVKPGTHISAMGADARGKYELDPLLATTAELFADVVAQSITIGEFEVAHEQALISAEAITTLGAVIAGDARGRTSDDAITIFDSSGIALQDLAVGAATLDRAVERGLAVEVAFA